MVTDALVLARGHAARPADQLAGQHVGHRSRAGDLLDAPFVIAVLWLGMLALRGSYDQRSSAWAPRRSGASSPRPSTPSPSSPASATSSAPTSPAPTRSSPCPSGCSSSSRRGSCGGAGSTGGAARGEFQHRTVVVGSGPASEEIDDGSTRDAYAGYAVVATLPGPASAGRRPDRLARRPGRGPRRSPERRRSRSHHRRPSRARPSGSWPGASRDATSTCSSRPAMMDITGPRLSVRPAAGLPLLHLDEAALSRPQRFAKRSLDLVGSLAMLVLLSPVLLACAIAVKVSSKGPVIFRQVRIGREGEPFTMLKFRTMVAERRRHARGPAARARPRRPHVQDGATTRASPGPGDSCVGGRSTSSPSCSTSSVAR